MTKPSQQRVVIEYGDILLRDENPADSEDRHRWNHKEMEWQKWDAPWEYALSAEAKEERTRQWEDEKPYKEKCLTEIAPHAGAWRSATPMAHTSAGSTTTSRSDRPRDLPWASASPNRGTGAVNSARRR